MGIQVPTEQVTQLAIQVPTKQVTQLAIQKSNNNKSTGHLRLTGGIPQARMRGNK
jgi:hypothetical protein